MKPSINIDPSEFLKRIREMSPRVQEAAKKGEQIAGIALIGIMMRDAPVRTGLLRSSGSVWLGNSKVYVTPNVSKEGGPSHPGSVNEDEFACTIGFNTSYAQEQDTRRDLNHPLGGKAGYFTDNWISQAKNSMAYVIREIKKILKDG